MNKEPGRTPGFFDLEKRIFEITDELETDIMKFVEPTNSVIQRKRFFQALKKGDPINPRYTYLPKNPIFSHFTITPEYIKIRKELEGIEIENKGIGKLLNKKKKELLSRMAFVRSIGSSEFAEKSKKFYGKPENKTIALAYEILSSKKSIQEDKTIISSKAAELLQRELNKRGLDWRVVLDENISPNAVVLAKSKILKIRDLTVFSTKDIKRLTIHEIETHIFRHMNGLDQPFRLFFEGPDIKWLKTEEGLAVTNESIFGLIEDEQLRTYAGRTVAVDFARRNSFIQTFKYLCEFFPEEKAYRITQRAKRGLNDTSQSGAFTKDFFYFQGALDVQEYLRQGGELKDLYYGKISIDDIRELDSIPKLAKPKFMPKYPKDYAKKAKFI